MAVTLINVFEVPAGRDENAQFRYVNLAEWQDPRAFQAAAGQHGFLQADREIAFAETHPSVYRAAEATA